MGKELRFDGKVAVVTGAGNGLGRAHALLLGSRGAKVVVNDLGGSHTGQGKSSAAADKVVAEIKAMGGEAVANYDSVEDGDKIVKTAIDAFGRIDILVNNAGILRDVSFAKMTQDDWDLVYRVHVLGAFRCTHAAWPYMRDQKYGRIIMTASAAGIYGNFGQANYAMAKLGLVGFAQTLAIEGRKNNVLCNVIAPIAGSRMTETVLPPELVAALSPEYVSPLVAKLCHESSEETGGLFEVGGGFYAKLRWERAAGKMYRLGRPVSIEDLEQAWSTITSFENATHPAHIAASIDPIIKNVEAGRSKGGNQYIDVDSALGYQFPDHRSSYDERDLALYALGVGAASDPTDDHDLQLVYELHGSGMKALPTYGVIPAINAILTLAKEGKQAPGLNYGLDRVLHGEQYLEVLRPLPSKAKLTHKARIKDIFDKGKGAVVITAVDSYDDSGELLVRNEVSTFVRGVGGWGGDRGPSAEINVPPTRPADQRVEERIHENQALLYRLSGDWNPLHADPGFAKAFGFDKPILHGLCTFGYASRHVLRHFAKDGDPRYFKSIKVRFADSVFPGETLVTEMWRESDTRIIFRCSVKEREKVVISNAAIELYAEIPKAAAKASSTAKPAGSAPAAMPISADIFGGIAAYIGKNSDAVGKVKTVYCFKLKGPDSSWTLDLKNGSGSVSAGEVGTADCTLEISDADFMDMCTGKADAMKLFTTGKLKITGNIMASQKLEFLKKIDPSDVIAAMKKRTGGGAAASSSPTASAPAAKEVVKEGKASTVFAALSKRLAADAGIATAVRAVIEVRVTDPASTFTVDLTGAGQVVSGAAAKADLVLTIADADLLQLASGASSVQSLYQHGKLRVDGQARLAHHLGFFAKLI